MLLGLFISAIDIYSLSGSTDDHPFWKTLHRISLTESIILVVALGATNILFFKSRKTGSQEMRHVDLLTGFVTRHAFGEIFEHALLAAKRSLEPLSVIILDIDNFRGINERYGHQVGDKLLLQLSQTIQGVLRASDITCRWEGDQFLIILKDCSTKDSCRLAKKMLKNVRSQTFDHNGEIVTITTSIGIAQMTSNDSVETLTARAETGLHSARDNGRNTCAIGYDWILINYSLKPILLPA